MRQSLPGRLFARIGCVLVLCSAGYSQTLSWPTISKSELDMIDDPGNPGAVAVLLYREVNSDDEKALETEYRRIKILKDAGRKYGDIEIAYIPSESSIEGIRARTVRPDGTAAEFQGEIFDRAAVKYKRVSVQMKTFTLPDVQVGSILEYAYAVRSKRKVPDVLKKPGDYIFHWSYVIPSTSWVLQEELFTRKARFSLHPFPGASSSLQWSVLSTPLEIRPQLQANDTRVLEIENIPGFQVEEYMLPSNWLRGRITFYYALGPAVSNVYWSNLGEQRAQFLEPYLGDPRKLKSKVGEIVAGAATPEAQLRKIYTRVQQIRYLSYEPTSTEQQRKRENLKQNKNVYDVLKNNHAQANEINLAFVALVRAAGFESAPLFLKSRATGLFMGDLPISSQLDAMVVWARAGGKDYYLDPATPYCPFGLLPWSESATAGVLASTFPDRPRQTTGNHVGVSSTPPPTPSTASIERRAEMEFDPQGAATGKVSITYTGQQALERRIATRNMDEAARNRSLEEEVKGWLSLPGSPELNGAVNWEDHEQPLRAVFSVRLSGYATVTSRRILFRAGLFESSVKAFKDTERLHDIYFPYPFEETDHVIWKVPPQYNIENPPENRITPLDYGRYSISTENQPGLLHVKREFVIRVVYLPKRHYAVLRYLFNAARQGDESPIVLNRQEVKNEK